MDFTIQFLVWVGAVSAAIVSVLNRLKAFDWSQFKKLIGKELGEVEQQLNKLIDESIDIVDQVFVDKLKETGDWDSLNGVFDMSLYQRNASEASAMCVRTLNSLVPSTTKKRLEKSFDDLELYFKNKIEQRIKSRE